MMSNEPLELEEKNKLLSKALADPVFFTQEIMNFKPFGYQKDFLRDNSKRMAFRAGRQVGKSTVTAAKAVYRALTRPNQRIILIGPSERQAYLVFDKVEKIIVNAPSVRKQVVKMTQSYIQFTNGSDIFIVPVGQEGDTARGFSPDLIIIDEAAFIKKDAVFTALMPSLSASNGDMILLSTPYGKRGFFYSAFSDPSYSCYHVPSKLSPLISDEFIKAEKTRMTEMEFKQEYEGEFMESADCFFSHELILSCEDENLDINKTKKETGKMYFLGVDQARFGADQTVYTIGEVDNITKDRIKIIKIIATSKMPLTDVIGKVKSLHQEYNFRAVYMDETGLGGGAVDVLMADKIPLSDLEGKPGGVTFTLPNKEEMYKNLKLLFEQGRIIIPKHDRLIMQLTDMQYEHSMAGHLQIHHPDRGHDDFPDSLALACIGLRNPKLPMVMAKLTW